MVYNIYIAMVLFLINSTNVFAKGIDNDTLFIKKVNEYLQKYETPQGPGMVVGVVENGRLIISKCFGYANIEHSVPNGAQTAFHVASVSKQVTAFCLLTLVDQGKVSLEDDVRQYISELPDYGYKITLHHLLTHTSGIREWQEMLWLKNWDHNNLITMDVVLNTLKQLHTLNFVPGEEFKYSNSNYDLVAEIIRRVSKMSLNEFAQKFVLGPFNMTHSCYQENRNQIISRKASGYSVKKNDFQLSSHNDVVAGSARFYTTLEDMYTWDQQFYSQDPNTKNKFKLMQTPVVLNNHTIQPYGYGLQLNKFRGYQFVEHSGSLASERAYIGRLPEIKFSVIVLSNSSNISPWQISKDIMEIYFSQNKIPEKNISIQSSAKSTVKKGKETTDSISYKKWAGIYKTGVASASVITYTKGKLMVNDALELVPKTNQLFYLKVNESLDFAFAESGREKMITISRFGDKLESGKWVAMSTYKPQLNEYLGNYYSEELKMMYVVSKDDQGNLTIQKDRDETWILKPTFKDAFQSEPIFIIFKRDNQNSLASFELYTYQTGGINFSRMK